MRKLNIGISVFATESSNIWNNGINQNVAFLGMLLRQSPLAEKIWFLNGGDAERLPPAMQFEGLDIPCVKPQEVTHEIDILIEMGATLSIEWMRRIHARGAKIVCFGVGHNFSHVAESSVFPNRQGGIHLTDPELRVETWGLAQHTKTCSPMMRTLTRKPVVDMPHLWAPYFLEKTIREKEAEGKLFGFNPADRALQRSPWKVAIFEPNIAVGKNCFIPMLACDHAFRLLPECIDHMMVMDSFKMKEHPTFLRFALNLELTRHSKASYEPRIQFASAMTDHSRDAVVAHHWEWGQNYLYYDALHGGYPLIHNSEFLQRAGVGIFYPRFSATEGGQALVEAWKQPPEFWEDYQRTAKDYLTTLHPLHPENIRIFTERLLHVVSAPTPVAAVCDRRKTDQSVVAAVCDRRTGNDPGAQRAPLQKPRLRRLDRVFVDSPIYFVTACTLDRRAILNVDLVHEAFQSFCRNSPNHGGWVGRYVLMPDHFHAFVSLEELTLSAWVKSLKNTLSKTLRSIGHDSPHWQKGFFDHLLRSGESYSQKWDYVRENPVRASLVASPEAWPYAGEIYDLEYRK